MMAYGWKFMLEVYLGWFSRKAISGVQNLMLCFWLPQSFLPHAARKSMAFENCIGHHPWSSSEHHKSAFLHSYGFQSP